MRFTRSGLFKGLLFSALVCVLVLAGFRIFGVWTTDPGDDPAGLVRQAREALDAVRQRKPGDRRPASYDSVLKPLDNLLRQAKAVVESPDFNPINDYDTVRFLAAPVIEVAAQADAQAKAETGFLTKDYRFNDQRGEASQYLAIALWERANALRPVSQGYLDETPPLPAAETNELLRVLNSGLEAAPDNRELWYLRGVVNRELGLFAPAAKDLEKAVETDPGYAAAWNTLGLVRISLKEFDRAEEALERARLLALDEARRYNVEPGAEYQAIVYNLAAFHEGLASYYIRENRLSPTVETRRLMDKHIDEARKYLGEFLSREPADSPYARDAQTKLNALPR